MVALGLVAAGAVAAAEKPVAGKQVRWEQGYWSAVPQVRNGKVSQCVLVARRPRAGKSGDVATAFSLNIGRGAGFAFGIHDDGLATENMLDDRAEVIFGDGRNMPAVGFNVTTNAFAFHPGDAAAALAALEKTKTVRLRSTGAGLDTGPIALNLPADALAWLQACGKTFAIAIDRPSDPDAPELPSPRPPTPEIGPTQWTPAGPPGIDDKQKIAGWDASELRDNAGRVIVCMIRRHYFSGAEQDPGHYASFFMVSRAKGLTMMLKNSTLKLTADQPLEATLAIDGKPFTGFRVSAISADEIGLYPQRAAAFAAALDDGVRFDFKSTVAGMEMPVQSGVTGWLRACARRHGIALEAPPTR